MSPNEKALFILEIIAVIGAIAAIVHFILLLTRH